MTPLDAYMCFSLALSHRITEWILEQFGLEGTFKGYLAQSPCSEQGHFQMDQVAQSLAPPGLECFQGWGTYHHSGQHMPVFPHPHCKEFLPSI